MNHQALIRCAAEGRIMHALLITGHDADAGLALAKGMAAAYLFGREEPDKLPDCPDYIITEPPYKVEGIRNVLSQLDVEAFSSDGSARPTAGRRAVLITESHLLNESCQNAILKTLEEPPEGVLFLLAGTEAGMLPTIRSRCAAVRIGASDIEETANLLMAEGVESSRAYAAADQSDGVLSDARLYATDAYAAFRTDGIRALQMVLLSEGNPFGTVQELLKSPTMPASGDSKLRQETANAPALLALWQAIARDALVKSLSAGSAPAVPPFISEAQPLVNAVAARFTTAQIQGIIDILCEAIQRLSAFKANPVQTLDWVLASLMEKEN